MSDVTEYDICLIDPAYFTERPELDGEANNKENRMYLGLIIDFNGLHCFLPFESVLHDHPLLRKQAQYLIPSESRPEGGVNFEKLLIITDLSYVQILDNPKIANSQKRKIESDHSFIKLRLQKYIRSYRSACIRGKEKKAFLFRYSTLHCFKNELGLYE